MGVLNGNGDPEDTAVPPDDRELSQRLHVYEGAMQRYVCKVPDDLYNALYQHVSRNGTTMSAWTRQAVMEKLQRDRQT